MDIAHIMEYYMTKIGDKMVLDFMVSGDTSKHNLELPKSYSKHIIIVLDTSGSMKAYYDILKAFVMEALNNIKDSKLSIIIFGSYSEIILRNYDGKDESIDKNAVIDKIVDLSLTNGLEAMNKIDELLIEYQNSLTNVIFMTDGMFNDRDHLSVKINDMKELYKDINIIFNAVGMSENHDNDLLDKIINIGSNSGIYCCITDENDIYLSIDNLCDFDNKLLHNIKIIHKNITHNIGILEKDNWFSCLLDNNIDEVGNDIEVIVSGNIIKRIDINKTTNHNDKLHFEVHNMRLSIVSAFENNYSLEAFIKLNDDLINIVHQYEKLDLCDTRYNIIQKRDIKIINQLCLDISKIIEDKYTNKINKSSTQLYLKFYNQHKNQYSIPSLKSKSCYNVRNIDIKLIKSVTSRFEHSELEIIHVNNLLEDDKFYLEKKYVEDNVICYMYLDNWLSGNCLGIGLQVLPKTTREIKRNLQPNIRIDQNFISISAFNNGVIFKYTDNMSAIFDDRDEPINNVQIVEDIINSGSNVKLNGVKSDIIKTINGHVNCWLPIYINKFHWQSAKYYMESSISLLLYQNNTLSVIEKSIDVYTNLFVRFVVMAIEEKIITEKSIYIFGYLYRTLLEIADKETGIKHKVNDKLEKFIKTPHMRSRRFCPNLGDIINLLFISDYQWKDCLKYYVPETIRRSACKIDINELLKNNQIIDGFSYMTKDYFKVSMLSIHLLQSLRKESLENTIKYFDDRHGLISIKQVEDIKEGFDKVIKIDNIVDKLNFLGFVIDDIGTKNLIIWAIKNRNSNCEIVFNKKSSELYENFVKGNLDLDLNLNSDVIIEQKQKISKDTLILFPDANNKSNLHLKAIKTLTENYFISDNKINVKVNMGDKYGFVRMDEEQLLNTFNKTNRIILDEHLIYYMDVVRKNSPIKSKSRSKSYIKGNNLSGKSINKVYDDFGFDYGDIDWSLGKIVDKDFNKDNIKHMKCIEGAGFKEANPIPLGNGIFHVELFKKGTMSLNKFLYGDFVISPGDWSFNIEEWSGNPKLMVITYN